MYMTKLRQKLRVTICLRDSLSIESFINVREFRLKTRKKQELLIDLNSKCGVVKNTDEERVEKSSYRKYLPTRRNLWSSIKRKQEST